MKHIACTLFVTDFFTIFICNKGVRIVRVFSFFFLDLEFVIERTEANGGKVSFKDYASLEQAFARKVSSHIDYYGA